MNPRLTAVFLLVLPLLASAPRPAPAACEDGSAHAYFNLSTGQGLCAVFIAPIVTVQITLTSVPATKARFSLPDPPFGTVLQETWNYPTTGNRLTGLEMNFGACQPGAIHGSAVLGTLQILVSEPIIPCTPWKIDDGCEIEDCNGVIRPAVAKEQSVTDTGSQFCACCFQCCEGLPAHTLLPEDNATAVPINVTLSWIGDPNILPEEEPYFYCAVRISTDPACGSGQQYQVSCSDRTFAPASLAPATTYYWQVTWLQTSGSGCSSGAAAMSPIQSFTTGDPLVVEPTTWGRVKAIYRD